MSQFLDIFLNFGKVLLLAALLWCLLFSYLRRGAVAPDSPSFIEKSRFKILGIFIALVLAVKIVEDVVSKDSEPIDSALMTLIHDFVPTFLDPLFRALTETGSTKFLVPACALSSLFFYLRKKRLESALLILSSSMAGLMILVVKTSVGRNRPELWNNVDWYWGSSFPSGHTLGVAAFGTALSISLGRVYQSARRVSQAILFSWISSVGFSRLVLGVHWPTDVLAALCIGVSLPYLIDLFLQRYSSRPANTSF